jgi:hypothetical protein
MLMGPLEQTLDDAIDTCLDAFPFGAAEDDHACACWA